MTIETGRWRGITPAEAHPPQAVPSPRSTRRRFLAAAAAALATGRPAGAATGDPRFPAAIVAEVGGKPVRLALTGTALRTKYLLRVYTVASYVQAGVVIRSPEALAKLDVPKQLILAFERDVDGATMGGSFRESIGAGHPAPAFAAELAQLERHFVANPVRAGDRLTLTHIPGVGLGVRLDNRAPAVIPGVPFAQAAWGAYFGPHHVGVAIQQGLTSRLR